MITDTDPQELIGVKGALYFQANDGPDSIELWKLDPIRGKLGMVKDINPGSGDSFPVGLTNFNGVLYFQANDGTHGAELWKSDGSQAGTVMVKDIVPGPGSVPPGF